jgi:ribosome-associated translation inhibitor RaiA
MDNPNFDFEFYSEVPDLSDDHRLEVQDRLEKLAGSKRDMIGASVAIEDIAGGETPHFYRARIVAYIKPENIVAVEKGDNIEIALKGALEAVERQVRKRREKFGQPWKRPSGNQEETEASPEEQI